MVYFLQQIFFLHTLGFVFDQFELAVGSMIVLQLSCRFVGSVRSVISDFSTKNLIKKTHQYNFISNSTKISLKRLFSQYQSIIINLYKKFMQQENTLTRKEQNFRVAFLGITFMIMFTAFNSLQNSVATIFNDYGYTNLGKASLLFLYFVFGISTFITPYFIRKWGYKKVMFISSLGYALYQFAGLIIALWEDCPKVLGWILVMTGAAACGASASMIWIAQGSYVSTVAGQSRKTELFGLFWMLMMSSQIVGNILITFVLGAISKVAYFIVLTALGTASAFLFLWLPNVEAVQEGQMSIKAQATKVFKIMKDSRYSFLIGYFAFTGVTIGFYATFIGTLVSNSVPQDEGQSDSDFTSRLNTMTGYVFIVLGCAQSFTGFIMNRLFEPFCKYKLAIYGTMIVQLAGFISLMCFFLNSYGLCFGVSALWGISETYLMTNTGALIGKVFPGKVQSFSVFRVCFAMGVVVTILLNISLNDAPHWIFLTIIMVIQLIATGLATQVMDLKEDTTRSLISKDETENYKVLRDFQEQGKK